MIFLPYSGRIISV